MKQATPFLVLVFFALSCAEQLMDKPENLIPKEKMVLIMNDLAIVNAAKVTNAKILRKHDIEPTTYIFTKYGIDSLQFVESDRYYASIPEEHEQIYKAVEAKLEAEKERLEEIKNIKDSLKTMERKTRAAKTKKIKDSLLKSDGKKK